MYFLNDLWSLVPPTFHTLVFQTDSAPGAIISGATTQGVQEGNDSTTITVIASPGHPFSHWEVDSADVGTTNPLVVKNVRASAVFTAVFLDQMPPVSALTPLSDATHVGAAIHLPFTASDAGSGVATTALWVKPPGAGAFAASGLTLPGESGAFDYPFADGNGLYAFATKATDNASNAEPDPVAAEATVLLNTVENGAFVWTLAAADATTTFPMTNDLDVVISITGATPGGSITVSRTTPLGTPPGGLPAAHLIDESLSIVGAGLGTAWTATITWPFDPDSAADLVPGHPINSVFQFDGAALTQTHSVTPGGPGGTTLVIPGVTSFSDWFAGNLAATRVVDWTRLD